MLDQQSCVYLHTRHFHLGHKMTNRFTCDSINWFLRFAFVRGLSELMRPRDTHTHTHAQKKKKTRTRAYSLLFHFIITIDTVNCGTTDRVPISNQLGLQKKKRYIENNNY